MTSATHRMALAATALSVAIAGCGDDAPAQDADATGSDAGADAGADAPVDDAGDASAGGNVWYGSIDALVATNCGGCHIDGGAAPFALDSPQDWEVWGPSAIASIDAERMPPWMPDPTCRELEHERIMAVPDRERLRQWLDAGRPEGDPSMASPTPERFEFVPDIELRMPEPYTPSLREADDYRCFILGEPFAADTWITGANIEPGNGLVHHVLTYALDGSDLEAALEADAAEDGPGYTCFGGPVPGAANPSDVSGPITGAGFAERLSGAGGLPLQIGAWVPGQVPTVEPEGVAALVREGSSIVMQIHYSIAAGDPMPDADTALLLQTSDDAPELVRRTIPLPMLQLEIPAGEPEVINQVTFTHRNAEPLVIRGMTGHMHLLGTRIQADIVRADGTRECGLAIPEWDFNWQQSYRMPAGQWVELERGDAIELTCVYDNTMQNQPVVNGVQIEPRDVTWGEGTLDEMCLLYLDTVAPWEPEEEDDGAACPASCFAACDADDAACLLACAGDDLECVGCVLGAAVDCGGTVCLAGLATSRECLTVCTTETATLGGSLDECLRATCDEAYSGVVSCLSDLLTTPACALPIMSCAAPVP